MAETANAAVGLVECLTDSRDWKALTRMLRYLADHFKADGAVLWEVFSPERDPRPNRLLVAGSWFRNGQLFAVHDLTLYDCPTGQAIDSNQPTLCLDVQDLDVVRRYVQVGHLDLHRLVVAPLRLLDGNRGAISLYRLRGERPFIDRDMEQLAELAKTIPVLHQAIRDRIRHDLARRVNDALAEGALPAIGDLRELARPVLHRVCTAVAEAFHSWEAAVFLRSPLDEPAGFQLVSTTWPYPMPYTTLSGEGQGITNWVLHNRRPVIIFDWTTWEQDLAFYQAKYPGISWSDPLQLRARTRQLMGLPEDTQLPPLSQMSMPIIIGGEVLGVVHCTADGRHDPENAGPRYFDEEDLSLLKVVATAIGGYWNEALARRRIIASQKEAGARTHVDLAHQLRSPLDQLQIRSEQLMHGKHVDPSGLSAIRGLARKARRVTRTILFLAKLQDEPFPKAARKPLNYSDLHNLLTELAEDHQAVVDPAKNIRFRVDVKDLQRSVLADILIERALLEQAVECIVDNATKYSFANTTVRISAGTTRTGRLHITVANIGIRISRNDVPHIRQRGYRTEEAEAVTAEGSGIGLWLVDRIMRAHEGFLEIMPTNDEGWTEVKLVF